MNYVERKKMLANLLGREQEDCRANDMTGLHGVALGGDMEMVVFCHDTKRAAEVLREALDRRNT